MPSAFYVENQYFQLPDWSILVKQKRQSNRQKMIEAGTRVDDIVPLHLFIVIPQPERNGMVPNTYDTLQQLDQGQGLGRYDAQVQGRIRDETQGPLKRPIYKPYGTKAEWAQYQQDMTVYEKQKAEREARAGAVVGGSARRAPANPRAELQQLGIKVLVATLMTYDHKNEARQIRISARDNKAETARAQQEAQKNQDAQPNALHGGQANDVDLGVNQDKRWYQKNDKCDIIPPRYREIYIHSKLMIIDDVYTTLGSANLNARSMAGDSELNICTENYQFTTAARKQVWGNLAGSDLDGGLSLMASALISSLARMLMLFLSASMSISELAAISRMPSSKAAMRTAFLADTSKL